MNVAKSLIFSDEARKKVLSGVEQLARAVKVTLGPKGRNVLIERLDDAPHITKDGVTVAKEIELKDPFENLGAEMVKEVASRTGDNAGDGTTTATVLAEAIFKEGLKNVVAGANPMALKRGIDKAVIIVKEILKEMARPVAGKEEITNIATVAANGDAEIGGFISDAFEKIGRDGVITVEESKTINTSVDVVSGMRHNQGFISSHFANNERMECVLEDCLILLFERRIESVNELMPILKEVFKAGKPLLIVSEDVANEALATIIINKMSGKLKVCAVKYQGIREYRKEALGDMAAYTGGKAFVSEMGVKLENIKLDDLGFAKKVIVDKKTMTLVEGSGTQELLAARETEISKQASSTDSTKERDRHRERLARLSGSIAVLRVGAATETEMKEKKDRIDDALHATRAAIEEGIVPGGGTALARASKKMWERLGMAQLQREEATGFEILEKAMQAPLIQITQNAGRSGESVLEKVLANEEEAFGYNAETDKFEDLVKAGVIDPVKVSRLAIENASSVSGLLLTTETVITTIREDKKEPQLPDFMKR